MVLIGYDNGYPMKIAALVITPELLRLIADLEEFKGSWRNLTTLAPEKLASLKRVATIESIGSSTRIEGAKLSDEEVESLLNKLDRTSFVSRDEQEVAGYSEVMTAIFDSYQEISISENYIKQLHAMLLRHSTKDERHRGEYKKLSNSVEAFDVDGKSIGTIFETATPFDTPMRMQELVSWTREALSDDALHPLIVIGLFVVVFLEIHPFQDGNGRLSRVLTTLLLLKAGYSYVPYSSLESIVEKNKEDYYLALRRTQGTLKKDEPNFDPWLRFFLRALKHQKDALQKKIEIEPGTDGLHPDSVKIIEYLKTTRRITTGEAEKLTQVPRPTVKSRLADLVKRGIIVRNGKGRGAWYGFPKPRE
jgi:Fic family protein